MNQDMSFGNLDNVQSNSFEPMPPGVYTLRALDIELKDTANGKGLSVEFSVVGGQYDDRKVFEFFNVMHTKQQVVEISLGKIKDWILATGGQASGELKLSQITELEGKTFEAKVGIQVDKTGQYDDQNKIKRFLSGTSVSQGAVNGSPSESQPATQKKKAWEK